MNGGTLRRLMAGVALTATVTLGPPALLPPGLPSTAAVALANPPCGPSNDGEQIDVGGNGYECGHIALPSGPAVWDWFPV
jgi:hypothetical protein